MDFCSRLRDRLRRMATTIGIDEALQRFGSALDALEGAYARRRTNEETVGQLEEEIQVLALDRAALAREIDEMKARAVELETVNMEVSRRLESAMESIRAVLSTVGS